MAKLLPPSKSAIVKSQKPAIIKADKLLNVKSKKTGVETVKSNPSTKLLEDSIAKIEKKVIKIDKLLKDSLLISKKENERKRLGKEQQKFGEQEKELEKKKPKPVKGIKLPSPPKMGFLDWIKNFITQTILGFFAVRLIEFLPQLLKILPVIIKVSDFIVDIGGKLLDGLITFVDWGYKAIDGTRSFIKNIGGENFAQMFDKFAGAIDNVLEIAVIAALATADSGGDGGGKGPDYRRGGRPGRGNGTGYGRGAGPGGGFRQTGGRGGRWQGLTYSRILDEKGIKHSLSQSDNVIMKRYFQRYGKDAFVERFGQEGLKRLPGGMQRGLLQRGARSAFMGIAGKGGAKAILGFVRPLLKRLPIIGALIDFGLSVALGEDPGRAAFKAIGAGILGTIGTAIGSLAFGFGGIVGGIIGSIGGDAIGGALYDAFFKNKKPKPKQGKTNKLAGGGQPSTRGGKPVGGKPTRTLKKKKTKRTLKVTPSKLKPGSSVGGEKKIKQLYPESKDKLKMSPFDFLKNSYDTFAKSSGLGALVALAIKPIMGDKPTYTDYKNAGAGINNWMNQSIGSGTLAYAGGGEVKMESIVSGEDYSDVIAKSLQDSVAPEIDKTIQDLMNQLMLKEPEKKKDPGTTGPGTTGDPAGTSEPVPGGALTPGQWGPLLDVIRSVEGGWESISGRSPIKGLTGWTIAEIAKSAPSYAGAYQLDPNSVIGWAKNVGLNPTDKFTPENQNKIAIGLIEGRAQGNKWVKGEISDTKFGNNLATIWAGLPVLSDINGKRRGSSYYAGVSWNKANTSPEKVESAFKKVKKGGYTQQELTAVQPGSLNKGGLGGSLVEYITGDPNTPFGRFDRSGHGTTKNYHDHLGFKDRSTAERAYNFFKSKGIQVTEFKGYNPVGGHAAGSLHYSGLAFDVPGAQWGGSGAIGPTDYRGSAKVRTVLKQFLGGGNTQIASKFGGGTGFVSKDGFTLKLHKGEMYKVVDKDSVDLFGKDFIQDIIDIENKSQLVARVPSIIEKLKSISGYTDYEKPYAEPEVAIIPIPMPSSGGGISGGTSKPSMYMNGSSIDTMGEQMKDNLMYG